MNILILLLAVPTVVLASPSASREIPAAKNCEIELKQYEDCVGTLKQDYEEIRKDGHAWKDVNKMTSFIHKMENLRCDSVSNCNKIIMEQHVFESTKHMLKAIYEESSECIVSLNHDQPKCSEEDIKRIETINELRKNLEILIEHKDKSSAPSNARNFHAVSGENHGDLGLFVNGKDDSESEETTTNASSFVSEKETATQTEEESSGKTNDDKTKILGETTIEDERPVVETIANPQGSEAQSSVAPDNETYDYAEYAEPGDPTDPLKNSTQEVSVGQEAISQPEDPETQHEQAVEGPPVIPPYIYTNFPPEEESEGSGSEISLGGHDNETVTLPNIDTVEASEGSGFEITLENGPKSTSQPEESEPVDMSSIYIGQPEPEDEEETPTATSETKKAESTPLPENEEIIDMTSIFIGGKEVEEEEAESVPEQPVEVVEKNETSIVPPNVSGHKPVENGGTQVSSAPQEVSVFETDHQITGETREQTVEPSQPVTEGPQKPGMSGSIKFEIFNGKNSISTALTPFMTVLALMLIF